MNDVTGLPTISRNMVKKSDFRPRKLFIRTRLDATATIVENGWWILEKGRVRIQPSHVSKPLKEPVWSTAN